MRQNHFHKLVFCSEMGIPREKVITIEVLLENGKWNNQSPYINDYIFDKNVDLCQDIGPIGIGTYKCQNCKCR